MKTLLYLTLFAPLYAQSPLARLPTAAAAQGFAAFNKSLTPGQQENFLSLPIKLPPQFVEVAGEKEPSAITPVVERTAHPAWTDRKVGVTSRFKLPFGIVLGFQYLKGKLGSEATFVATKKF